MACDMLLYMCLLVFVSNEDVQLFNYKKSSESVLSYQASRSL